MLYSKVAKAMLFLGIRSIVSKKFPHRKSTLTNEEKTLIVTWGLCEDQKTDKLIATLKVIIEKRKPLPSLICHSDKGSQMRSKLYKDFLKFQHFVFSYTSLNHSYDENDAQESFHASLKKERLYQMKLYTFEDAYKAIFD